MSVNSSNPTYEETREDPPPHQLSSVEIRVRLKSHTLYYTCVVVGARALAGGVLPPPPASLTYLPRVRSTLATTLYDTLSCREFCPILIASAAVRRPAEISLVIGYNLFSHH